ncbi:uncharacterized protein LOC121978390 [Zingiber officinale]|uniref:uncharacterized protein LOC121978390 n=1 Tax=Zingiber officinale TaxID=94328 RepID=UPI001C4C529B|nr:uncharacterized protein LOC121978390 [Zingiber officinale]
MESCPVGFQEKNGSPPSFCSPAINCALAGSLPPLLSKGFPIPPQMPRPRRLYDDLDASPGDDSRCRRSDGRKWRCHKRAMDGLTFCEYHYIQTRSNMEKHKASAARKSNRAAGEPPSRKRRKKAELLAEHPIAPKRRMKREEESGEGEARTTRVLPNGLMTIATPSVGGRQEEGGSVDRKVGFEDGCLLTRRCIRSKNAEPIPVATIKNIPCGRGPGMGRKRICHSCKEKNVVKMVRCLSCRKRFFCSRCIKKRYSGMLEKEVKIACPVCRDCCDCQACSRSPAKDGYKDLEIVQEHRKTECANSDEISLVDVKTVYPVCHGQLDYPTCSPLGAKEDRHKELTNGQNKFNNKEHTYSLISELLPLLKHIYQNQLNELEVKQGDQEGGFSGVLLRVYEPHNELVNCNYCRTSLVDFHRSCSNCSYKLCLDCCGKILKGTASQTPAIDSSKAGRRQRAKKYVISEIVGKRRRRSTGERPDNSSLSTVESDSKVKNHGCSIPCPPKESGGCGNGILKLSCSIPFVWSNDLGHTAEEVAFSSDLPHSLHTRAHRSSLLEDKKVGHFSISLQEASNS